MNSKPPQQGLSGLVGGLVLPWLGVPLAEAGAIVKAEERDGTLHVELTLGLPLKRRRDEVARLLQEHLHAQGRTESVELTLRTQVRRHAAQGNLQAIEGVQNIIAVASGKGGVGKSTTAVNLALALAAEGASVGILDADIYGPSVPRMLALMGQRPAIHEDGKSMYPLLAYGIEAMSIGFLIGEDEPMAWRGPMVTQALNQLLTQTRWGDLDYLLVDMPPGTGDIQLTLSQKVPVSGAVLVTTPQDIALQDARKGLEMFRKVNVQVLGIVENMSTHICSQCGHEEHVFGAGGGERIATQYGVPLLGSLPLDARICEDADSGAPSVVADPDSAISRAYREAALHMAGRLALSARSYSHHFPKIVVEDS